MFAAVFQVQYNIFKKCININLFSCFYLLIYFILQILKSTIIVYPFNVTCSFSVFQVEPSTKLFPAVFCLPSSQNMLQVELGKLKVPISC